MGGIVADVYKRVPDGQDIMGYQEPWGDRPNDIDRLERTVIAMLDCLSGAKRLEILNQIRQRESRDDDCPYYVADTTETGDAE